jgi:hypothetical protein
MKPSNTYISYINWLEIKVLFLALIFLLPFAVQAQLLTRKALFLGNSYTYVNNLPFLIASLSSSSGDSLVFDSNTPGGFTLGWQPIAHSTDPVSLAKIKLHDWDFVVLQEQSQTPAISRLRDSCMYPSSIILHDSIKSAHPCSRVLFYLTWGRRFGGTQCFVPNYCSPDFSGFNQMQDSLTRAYKGIADSLADWIAPVGESWRFVINTTGMVLHDADDSHPNLKGSYLAACVFYAVIFGKQSSGNSFTAGLTPDTALKLQQAADSITFGYSTHWNLNNDIPFPAFTLAIIADTLFTTNLCSGASSWLWDFGDGQSSGLFEPVHVYANTGTYTVRLKACNDCFCDSTLNEVTVTTTGLKKRSRHEQAIRLQGPDHENNIKVVNFTKNGTLSLYHITGSIKAILPVYAGVAHAGNLGKGIMLWRLTDEKKEVIGRGKIITGNPFPR